MASVFGVENLLLAIFVELFTQNTMFAEENGFDGEIAEIRADALKVLGGDGTQVTGTPDASSTEATENS